MHKIFAIVALGATLAGCGLATVKAVTGFTVSQDKVAIAVTASVAAEKLVPKVLRLPICLQGQKDILDGCVSVKLGDQIKVDLRAMQAARNSLWAAAKADPNGVGAYDAYEAFKAVTNALRADVGQPALES